MWGRDDDDWIAKLVGGIIAALVGFGLGAWLAKQKAKQEPLDFPPTLEVDTRYEPPKQMSPYMQRMRKATFWMAMMFFACYGSTALVGGVAAIFSPVGFGNGVAMFVIGVVLGYGAFRLWRARHKMLGIAPRWTAALPARNAPLDLSRARAYTIALPHATPWQPQQAGRFVEHILHKLVRLTFQIVADGDRIRWRILDLRRQVEPSLVEQTVLSFYPDAEIEVEDVSEETFDAPFHRYVMAFKQGMDFAGPITYVDELTRFDPLVNLTQEMGGLREGERVVYTLFVADFADYAHAQAEKVLTVKPPQNPFKFLTPGGWVDAGYEMVAGEQRQDRYRASDQKVLETKLVSPLYQCLLLVQIDAPTQERVRELARYDSHVFQFRNMPFNALVWYEEPWPESIRYIEDVSRAHATGTLGLLNAFLTNNDRRWQDFRLILEPRELAALWHLPHEGFTAPKVLWSRSRRVGLLPEVAGGSEGVRLGMGWFAGRQVAVCLPDGDRATHVNVVGKTGVGKSTLLHHLIYQDIAAGRGVGVIDPHGKLVRDILQASIPPGREADVVVLDLANAAHPPPLNPLGALPGAGRSYVSTGRIVSILEKLYGGFEHAPRMSNALSSALLTLRNQPQATVRDVVRLFLDEAYRSRMLAEEDNAAVLDFWYEEYENFSEAQQAQIRDPVVYRLRAFFRNPDLYPIICHPDALDFAALMRAGKIILVSLGVDEERVSEGEKNLIGAMLVSQLQMAVMGKQPLSAPFYLYIDEVQNFVTSALDRMFEEARKYLLSLTVAHQYLRQLTGPTLDAVMGTVGATVAFQCGLDDARALAPYMRPGFDAEDLVNLDKFQAAVKMRYRDKTQPAFSLSTLEPPAKPEAAEEREAEIRRISAATYTPKTRDEVMAWLNARYPRPGSRQAATAEEDIFYDPT